MAVSAAFFFLITSSPAQGQQDGVHERLERLERALSALERTVATIDSSVKRQLAKSVQERKDDAQGFLRSQATLDTKLDELTTEVRLAQGRTDEIGHGISELNRRFDELSFRIEQLRQRASVIENQLSQAGSKSETASGTVGPAHSDRTDPLDEGAGVEISVTVRTADPTLAYYFVLIQDKITGNWTPPRVVPSTVGTINLSMKVLRSGQVRDLTLKSSSGDRLLDDSALRAVRLSTPLPPLPPLFKAETLFLELQFTAVSDRTTGKLQTRIEEEQASAATPSSAGKKATGQEGPAGSRDASPPARPDGPTKSPGLPGAQKQDGKTQQQATRRKSAGLADEILRFLNRGEGLGKFRACEAIEVTTVMWRVVLCVPEPETLSADIRSIMGPGVGFQALKVLKELEGKYPKTTFFVSIRSATSRGMREYGFAFRNETREPVYKELRPYE
jgi:TonB family protein